MIFSELRQDLVSGDWILIAPGRLRYQNHDHRLKREGKRERAPLKQCPFEKPLESVSNKVILNFVNHTATGLVRKTTKPDKNWRLLVLENKHPVVLNKNKISRLKHHGPFSTMEGIGHADLIITRDHDRNFPKLSKRDALHVLEAMRDRYLTLLNEKNLAYISIFHNWGPTAGASVYHPHYQMFAIPVLPPDIQHSLNGSARYYKAHKTCVHCDMIRWEKRRKKRIIFENDEAVALAPFVSRNPFEVRVFPKRHRPYFENTFNEELAGVSEVLQKVLGLLEKKLGDPDYNFFIHTAPVRDKNRYSHYHWHIEIYPKLSKRAGFEFGTGIEVNIFDPDKVAKILKSQK
ncbi:MAG: Galactose-1-phosphate uridylyltransferase [Candidatus Jorgensenbacteria bacterium GW2011_GWA1_48_11]|uniref:Galactose-1-phosphate uridylyltransferase n=1 Tax=Candidatus Jorgensenbacteria bacterium GW2011_GWA1_48_11 TaxID=1618660 RepID=A0A0G1XA39_9BACT|nr:MAG: Galactose-1-phosphate uridylyltransferase [Candidatus Jorgensenbacteria bacterium GW2011_GWA1_48_11]KKW11888.1 MAG: Galactose-1-phosphate uridylyltransferase [Candidatus Jorgensenbacteria bacterium GW2011_GWB1_49_9]